MPVLKPFKALRSKDKNIENFPSKNIDSLSEQDIRQKSKSIDYSIVQIIEPVFNRENSREENNQAVRKNYEDFITQDILVQDNNTALYVYAQKGENFKHTGIIGLFDLRNVQDGKIKLHENTITKRKEAFASYLEEVHIQSEPILLTYPSNSKMELLIDNVMKSKNLFSFTDEDGVEHKVWKVDNRVNIKNIVDSVARMDALYLADGHHRLGSTELYSERQKAQEKDPIGTEPYHYILGYAVGSEELVIHEYNRLVKDLNGLSKEEFLSRLSENFTVVPKGKEAYFPSHKHHISMYLEGEFYGLYIDHSLRGKPAGLGELDTYLYEELIGKPILDIQDSREDDRVDFIKGTGNMDGIMALKNKVDEGGYAVGFAFYPIHFNDMKLISDLDLKMPPKSTYINPKLLTGLLMYKMK